MSEEKTNVEEMNEEKIQVESLDVIVFMINGKPCYEIKYKEIGNDYYNIGYSSYNLDFVLEWKEKYFEVLENKAAKDTAISGKWIPCSERLPENNKLVLGWYKDIDNPFSGYKYGIVMKTSLGWVFDYGNRYCSSVAAWMPLPEPYKEDYDD